MIWHPDMPTEYRNQIVTGDARELAKRIPDESVDLIFTDPVYDRIDDYRWLAEAALRVLKPNRACLVWSGKRQAARCQLAMEGVGLGYVYTLDYVVLGKQFRLNYYHLFCWTTPCLWMQKGRSVPMRWMPDTIVTTIGSRGPTAWNGHGWNKNPQAYMQWMDAFTVSGGIVLDPFCGGGTAEAVAHILGRNYVAFEIDEDTAELARQRVANTQPPLFVSEPEQMELAL